MSFEYEYEQIIRPEPIPTTVPPVPITQQIGSNIQGLQEVGLMTKELFDIGKSLIAPSSVGFVAGLGGIGWGLAIGIVIGGVLVWFFLTQADNGNDNDNKNGNNNNKGNILLTRFKLPF